ncbi:hypothetical protein IEO21_10292 [Rhodonia placenta]|uniref:WD40 repeat-like protein n=1 Tax=Rhodonia placenta TaxID=104341 RepID=A0A8H7NST0_9APHY|nr:hypothetical protein IEO21_10292 [Postia placenta]
MPSSAEGVEDVDYAQGCVTPRRKRTWEPASITNALTNKRRRISMASFDLTKEIDTVENFPSSSKATVADRFIAAPRESPMPLNITPRTNRIARQFGLAKDRVLSFADSNTAAPGSHDLTAHRTNFQRLFSVTPKVSPASAAAHLGARKHFVLALDGPGVPADPFAFPLTWSAQNAIAVACGRDLYYQDLGTRNITHLGTLPRRGHEHLVSIEWSRTHPQMLAAGTSTGVLQLWDTNASGTTRDWHCKDFGGTGGMDWWGDLLAVGEEEGTVELFDAREPQAVSTLSVHKHKVLGVKWSTDGDYLATGDERGVVQALAWCPWKTNLLATGSTYPDGKVRIWNVNSTSTTMPMHTLSLNTSVTSLIWSPNCKELLSTHGTSWQPRSASMPGLSELNVLPSGAVPVKSHFTNSITVHSYPSLKRVVSVPAHSAAVGHSCLSPDGTLVFTICPAEEAMKMWKVWGIPENRGRRESVFDKCGIR